MAYAKEIAVSELIDPMLLSWYDAVRGVESPNGVSECSDAPATQGVWNYALHRGGVLAVWCDDDCSVFCFCDIGEPSA